MSDITVFSARKIITMDPNRPQATHVAVRDGRILAVGGADCADQWGAAQVDDRLAGKVLMPGFVEGHAHMWSGSIWDYAYAGFHDRIDPQGKLWRGRTTVEQVIAGLRAFCDTLPDDVPLVGWGFDPIFLKSEQLTRHHLDQISPDRPIAILYSNFHLLCANSKALEMAQFTSETNLEGVTKGEDGQPNGILVEMAAMFPVMRRLGIDFRGLSQSESAIRSYGEVAKRAGVTTATDLLSSMEDADLKVMLDVTGAADFPLRIVPAISALGASAEQVAARALELRAHSTDKLRMGAVKLMTDGAIQGYTARLKWPGYVGGQPNGVWNIPPEQIFTLCEVLHREGVQMHIHVNGDEAAEVTIDALEAALQKAPWAGHRHVLQHCQMMDAPLYRRAAELGLCTNIFSNHLWFFGDKHATVTVGDERACRMNAARSALQAGVHIALHSDAPVTPLAPLFTAWCAVNRHTMSGRVLGAAQCLTVQEALFAITLGAAYTLKMDSEIGSIEPGKIADFAILGEDPAEVDPLTIKDVPVLGTVSGGVVHLL